jgi:HlyD family type I secretion membrane fusion protein
MSAAATTGATATALALAGDRGQWAVPERPPVGRLLLAGLLALAVGIGGFGGWAAVAPLSSAAIATGMITVAGNRKVVQHLEGGSIAELRVREGDRVRTGQLLMRLDDLEAKALHDVLEGQHVALAAQEARLQAERESRDTLAFPAALEAQRRRPEIAEILDREVRIFESGRAALRGQVEVLGQRIAQLVAQIAALHAQASAGEEQLAFVDEEVADVGTLFDKGLERKPRLLALKRTRAFIKGQQGEYANRMAGARETIAETEFQILNVVRDRVERAALRLGEVSMQRAQVEERLAEARVKLGRRQVVAPIDGTVLRLRYHTVGGVVEPARAILEIVPDDDVLVAEARINPNDIDIVHAGLDARVVLSAYKRRNTPQLSGKVLQVSPDIILDEQSNEGYFVARIAIDGGELANLEGVHLSPGMPVEVFIRTGERSTLDYLLQPVADSLRRAFREH